MRNLCLTFFVCLLVSCGGTKKVIEPAPKPVVKSKASSTNTDTIVTLKTKQKDKTAEVDNFDQNLTKRTLTQHQLWNKLLEQHVSKEGYVDYKGFKKDHEKLLGYIRILQLSFPKGEATKNQKLSYWINAYNAFTVDLILRHYPIKSIKNIKNPWKQRHWKLNEKWYNLDEIEHQILRKMNEPRIHFAINCASVSCPKLQNMAFTNTDLEEQLTKATRDFLEDPSKNQISEDQINLSKLFQWFAKDFKQNGSLIDFINRYSDIQISEKAKTSFKEYNWELNE